MVKKGIVGVLTIGFLMGGVTDCFGQFPGMPIDANSLMHKKINRNDPEAMVEAIEAMLIKTIFLEPMFNNDFGKVLDDDDDLIFSAQMDMQNNIMSNVLSQSLAKKDILGLKKRLLKDLKAMSK